MSYSGQTSKYRIPYIRLGDILEGVSESRRGAIFDNMVFGAIRGHSGGHGILREGDYTFAPDGATYKLTLAKNNTDGRPAIEAFINQVYITEPNTFSWTGLTDNNTHYLYLSLVESSTKSSLQNSEFAATSSTILNIPQDGILMASVSIIAGVATINIEPTGKILIPLLSEHIADNTDPHGSTLNQTNLNVTTLNVQSSATFEGPATFQATETHQGPVAYQGPVVYQAAVTFNGPVQFKAPVNLDSGIPVDGVDISVMTQFIDGSNVGSKHIHSASGAPVVKIGLAPSYPGCVISGTPYNAASTTPFIYEDGSGTRRNALRLKNEGSEGINFCRAVVRVMVPDDFGSWSGMQFTSITEDGPGSNSYVGVRVQDTTGVRIQDKEFQYAPDWYRASFDLPGGTFVPGEYFDIYVDLQTDWNSASCAGDIVLAYFPSN